MKFSDAVFGLVLLALGLTVLAVVGSYPTVAAQRVGPSLFPSLIAVGLVVGGVILVVRGWRERATVPMARADAWARSGRHVVRFLSVVAAVAFYLVAVNRLGFVLTSLAILASLFRIFGVPLARSVAIAAIATLAIHLAFYKLLRVPLPWGLLAPIAW